jgi:hypothetical protein
MGVVEQGLAEGASRRCPDGLTRDQCPPGRRGADGRLRAGTTEAEQQLADLEADDRLAELWEHEWRDALLRECLRVLRSEVRPRSLAAFERFGASLPSAWPPNSTSRRARSSTPSRAV